MDIHQMFFLALLSTSAAHEHDHSRRFSPLLGIEILGFLDSNYQNQFVPRKKHFVGTKTDTFFFLSTLESRSLSLTKQFKFMYMDFIYGFILVFFVFHHKKVKNVEFT
jgi:hypothetical protein